MALVASINGTSVYSDKAVSSVRNNKITFCDGSWCNVKTGKVHNVGSGFIDIGDSGSDSNAEKITKGHERVSASSVELWKLAADVTVEAYDGREIEYSITGPSNRVNDVNAIIRGDTLVIEGKTDNSSGGMIVIGGGVRSRFGNVSIASVGYGNTVIIGDSKSEVAVTVKVPTGTAVTSNRVIGNVVIGDIDAAFTATVQAGDIQVGRITDANLQIQGDGNITINEVTGSVVGIVQGSGDIEIKKGSIQSLNATIHGSGDISVGGDVQVANLTVMGSGDITVNHVVQTPMKNVMGSGKIRVRHVG
jgi:hypothetical protein